jgi:hypothetical protein
METGVPCVAVVENLSVSWETGLKGLQFFYIVITGFLVLKMKIENRYSRRKNTLSTAAHQRWCNSNMVANFFL